MSVIFAKSVDLAYGYLWRKDVVATPMWDERDIEGLPVCTVYLVGGIGGTQGGKECGGRSQAGRGLRPWWIRER